ncbi:DUF1499 domain-containing protein [Sessilibacter sp. MAH2]
MTHKLSTALFLVATVLFIFFVLKLAHLANDSKKNSAPGLLNDVLTPCPNAPNCISSELHEDNKHSVRAIALTGSLAENPWPLVRDVIEIMGGEVTEIRDYYCAAQFSTKFFKFVDDFELRWDEQNKVLHVRSASRVGYSDLGENKKRIAEFKSRLMTLEKNRSQFLENIK